MREPFYQEMYDRNTRRVDESLSKVRDMARELELFTDMSVDAARQRFGTRVHTLTSLAPADNPRIDLTSVVNQQGASLGSAPLGAAAGSSEPSGDPSTLGSAPRGSDVELSVTCTWTHSDLLLPNGEVIDGWPEYSAEQVVESTTHPLDGNPYASDLYDKVLQAGAAKSGFPKKHEHQLIDWKVKLDRMNELVGTGKVKYNRLTIVDVEPTCYGFCSFLLPSQDPYGHCNSDQ